jgi:hypothetical protein
MKDGVMPKSIKLGVTNMTIINKGIAKQCKPNLLSTTSYLLFTQGVFQ